MYNDKLNTNFNGNKIPEENGELCMFVCNIRFVKVNKESYPQIFLEECKYAIKKKNIINVINEELNLDKSDD